MKQFRYLSLVILLTALSGCQSSSSESSSSEIVSSNTSSQISSDNSFAISSSETQRTLTTIFYQNPIYSEDFADPSVIRHTDGTFYAFATGAKVLKSNDLAAWTSLPRAIVTPTWGTTGANIWAPDVQYIQGQYVMYYSLSRWDDPNPGIGIATAPHPEGPWTDHGKLFRSLEIGVNNSIDPMVYVEDERVYMFWGSFRGIYAIELSADGLSLKDENIETAAQNKVHIAGYTTDRNLDVSTYEGVYLVKKDNFYYLFLSTGQCCSGDYTYNVKVGRSTTILGEYTDHLDRSMRQGAVGYSVVNQNAHFIAVGHNSIVVDDAGTYWMLYHGFDNTVATRSKRMMLMDKLNWDGSGWPSTLGTSPSNNRRPGPELYLS